MKSYSTRKASEIFGVSFSTIKNWIRTGKLNTYLTPTNQHRITEQEINRIIGNNKNRLVATYSRVSSSKQRDDLKRQIERLNDYCKEKSYDVIKNYSEISSGLNDSRKQLHKLLDDIKEQKINVIIVENKDRLTRFGYEYLNKYIASYNARIEITNDKEIEDDIVKDLIDIVTCFCAKLYGKRSSNKKTKEVVNKCLGELK
jgi:predicted site-specific integrase-resolvase